MTLFRLSLLLAVALAAGAEAAGPASRMLDAAEDRVWAVTEALLKHQGWEITVERALFHRARILWMDKDEPLVAKDQDVEDRLLDDIRKSL